MSKWWKLVKVFGTDPAPFDTIEGSFLRYIEQSKVGGHIAHGGTNVTRATIAVIAFQPYQADSSMLIGPPTADAGWALTVASLGATLASLVRTGIGRVIVLWHHKQGDALAQAAFRLVRDGKNGDAGSAEQTPVVRIGNTEVGSIKTSDASLKVNKNGPKVNLPRAALFLMQRALRGELDNEQQLLWLGGSPNRWQYVYLTEPDSILHIRQSALDVFGTALDEGMLLTPHRLQPIPHESDLTQMKKKDAGPGRKYDLPYVPLVGNLSVVVTLDSLHNASCCDRGDNKDRPKTTGGCGQFWWMDGFCSRNPDPLIRHKRLLDSGFLRLQGGTGITSLAGNEHGRSCTPRENAICGNIYALRVLKPPDP